MTKPPKRTAPQFDPERVRDVSEAVYRIRLGKDAVARMVEKHGEDKIREFASSYDVLTRAYFLVLGEEPLSSKEE